MSILSADKLKKELTDRLEEVVVALDEYNRAESRLKAVGAIRCCSSLYFTEMVEKTIVTYYQQVCDEVTREFANGTPATVHCGPAPKDLFRLTHGCNDIESQREAILKVVGVISFSHIHQYLCNQAASLEQKGREIQSDQLMKTLGFMRYSSRPLLKSARVHCIVPSATTYYRDKTVDNIKNISSALMAIHAQSEIDFGASLDELMEAVMSDQAIASRTVFGRGNHLEIHCFRDKYELRFTRSAFDAISAFVLIYGDGGGVGVMIDFMKEIAEAA